MLKLPPPVWTWIFLVVAAALSLALGCPKVPGLPFPPLAPIAVFATTHFVHIPFEEAKMSRQFGSAYDDYVARVRRWL